MFSTIGRCSKVTTSWWRVFHVILWWSIHVFDSFTTDDVDNCCCLHIAVLGYGQHLYYNAHASFQCLVVSLWPSNNLWQVATAIEEYINTLSRSRWWVAPTTTTVVNMILCSTSSSLLMDERPAAAYIFLWSFLGNIFLWSFFGKFQTLVEYRLFSLWYDCYQSLWYDCYQVYFLRICSLAWLLRVQWDSNFICTAVPLLYDFLWLMFFFFSDFRRILIC